MPTIHSAALATISIFSPPARQQEIAAINAIFINQKNRAAVSKHY
jgi:hypothetical protein